MNLQTILFGEFKPPTNVIGTRQHLIMSGTRPLAGYVDPEPRKPRPSPTRDKMLAALNRWPGQVISKYAQLTATPKETVGRVFMRLQADGLVTKRKGAKRAGGGRSESHWYPVEGL